MTIYSGNPLSSSSYFIVTHIASSPSSGKKKKKLRGKKAAVSLATTNCSSTTTPWYRLTPELLWQQILTESNDYYDFNIEGCGGIDDVVEMFGIQKISFLRRLCHVVGIQVAINLCLPQNSSLRHRFKRATTCSIVETNPPSTKKIFFDFSLSLSTRRPSQPMPVNFSPVAKPSSNKVLCP